MASAMGIPEKIKSNVREMLQSKKEGVPIAIFFKNYMELFEEPLDFRKMGFKRVEDFVSAIPDIARLELSQIDQGYRILKTKLQNSFPVASTEQEHMPASHLKDYKTAKRTSGHNTSSDWDNEETDLQPDAKGLYSLCFSGSNKPSQPLEPLFNQAGPLCRIHENKGMVFIQYYSRESALKAIDMFPHLNLRATRGKKPSSVQSGSPNEKKQIKSTTMQAADYNRNAQTGKRAEENFNRNAMVSPSEECEYLSPKGVQKTPFETPSVNKGSPKRERKLFISNISMNATKEELYDLLRERHHVGKLIFRSFGHVRLAFVTMRSKEEADVLMQEFDTMLWHGRALSVQIYEKKPRQEMLKGKNLDKTPKKRGQVKKSVESKQFTRKLSNQTSPEEEMPPLEDEMPELEEDIPELEVDIPELEADIPELEADIPEQEADIPELEADIPELEADIPEQEADIPELEADIPELEADIPELEADIPELEMDMAQLEWDVIKHEQSSVATLAENNKEQESNQSIIIENFPDEASKRELIALFFRYHPINVTFMSNEGCKKAVIQLTSPEDVKKAVAEMNQQVYMGKTLLVDLPPVSPPHEKNEGEPVLSTLLKLREFIIKQMAKPILKIRLGQRLEVLVTSVVSDRFFWGQIITPESRERLQEIAGVINSSLNRRKKREGYGRCVAVFDSDDLWYRAWIFRTTKGSDSAGVFFIDYGNTSAFVPWDKIAFCTNNSIWDQCAMATPFTLTDPVVNLKERELTSITVEVTACETEGEEGNFIIARPISLTGMSQILVAAAAVKQMTLKNRHVQSS